MFLLTLTLALLGLVQAHFPGDFGFGRLPKPRPPFGPGGFQPQPQAVKYRLCTYSDEAYAKCRYTVQEAQNNTITLPLDCVQQESRDNCLQAVRSRLADMVVLEDHDYKIARANGLIPVLFAREDESSLYIAVAPRNISLVEINEAPLDVDLSNERAFHAAAFFNLLRGHNICRTFYNAAASVSIKIVDSATYTPTDDEFLLCPKRIYAEYDEYRSCNFEASLERAVFVGRDAAIRRYVTRDIQNLFNRILQLFGPVSLAGDDSVPSDSEHFNFFSTFDGSDDVIFKNDTIAFDMHPISRNDFNEQTFNKIHCNTEDQKHDPSQLE